MGLPLLSTISFSFGVVISLFLFASPSPSPLRVNSVPEPRNRTSHTAADNAALGLAVNVADTLPTLQPSPLHTLQPSPLPTLQPSSLPTLQPERGTPDKTTEEEAAEVKEKQEAMQAEKAVAVQAAQEEQEASKTTTAGPTTPAPTTPAPTTPAPTTPAPTTAGAKKKQEAGDIVGTVSGSKRERAKANLTGSASTLFLPPASEWLDDIDTKSSILGCGDSKCAFHSRTSLLESRTNPDHRDRYGYLVTEVRKVKGAFELAQELSKTFSIRHTLLAAPINIMDLDVEPTELYPKGSILFKCPEWHVYKAMESVKSLQSFSADVDPQAFEERLQSDLHKVEEVMDSQHGPCLSRDFQLVIDAITGSIIHIDIDRCYTTQGWIPTWSAACLQNLTNVSEYLIARKHLHAIDGDRNHRGENHDDNVKERISNFRETVELFNKYTETHPNLWNKSFVAHGKGADKTTEAKAALVRKQNFGRIAAGEQKSERSIRQIIEKKQHETKLKVQRSRMNG